MTKIALQRAPDTRELEPQLGGVTARIDDDGLGRTSLGAHDVAVRADRTHLVTVDDERHDVMSLTTVILFPAVQSWNLHELDTPGGSRSPVVVHSENEARAVLIGLDPGQALGDHQVHERSYVVVLDGRVRFESGGETVDAGPGYLAWFDADERHSICHGRGRADPADPRAVARRGPLPRRRSR